MKKIATLSALAMVLATAPALAQTIDDTTDPVLSETADSPEVLTSDGSTHGTATDGTHDGVTESKTEGMFSRMIPSGLKAYFSNEEEADYQARLDEATTPQERNEVRRELQRQNQERHLEKVQATKREKQEAKGFFDAISDDFNDVVSGRASQNGYERSGGRDRDTQLADRGNGKSKDRGGKSGGRSGKGGGKGGGNGGGNGGGGKNR